MNYPKAIIFVFSFTIALIFFSCEKGTEPEGLKPGRRDYTWEVDTLKAWNTHLMKMWGSSPTDIWAVGHGSTFDQTIWHYNGTKSGQQMEFIVVLTLGAYMALQQTIFG